MAKPRSLTEAQVSELWSGYQLRHLLENKVFAARFGCSVHTIVKYLNRLRAQHGQSLKKRRR